MSETAVSSPTARGELDFSRTSREIRGLVARRREIVLFLGAVFAAMAVYLRNVLEGKLPAPLADASQHAFALYSLAIAVPTAVLALRVARIQAGMTIQGVFFAALVRTGPRPSEDPAAAARVNWFGLGAQIVLLAAGMAGLAAALMALAFDSSAWFATAAGLALFAILTLAFTRFQRKAARFALDYIANAKSEPVDYESYEDHQAHTLQDMNHDMLATISLVALIVFSVFESLSSLGEIRADGAEFTSLEVQTHGPRVYSLLAWFTCLQGVIIYLRLATGAARVSTLLDPTDRPFRMRLTDTLLGYVLLLFFFAVATHLAARLWLAPPGILAWIIDFGLIGAAALAYPVAMAFAGRRPKGPAPGMR